MQHNNRIENENREGEKGMPTGYDTKAFKHTFLIKSYSTLKSIGFAIIFQLSDQTVLTSVSFPTKVYRLKKLE